MASSTDQTTERSRRLTLPPSLAELATDQLRDMIFSGELLPGERLVEDRLAERMGVSRPPLREALKNLQHDGLVERLPRGGTAVRSLNHHDVYEIYTLRADLERLALQLALPDPDPDRLQVCRDAIAAMRRSAELGDQAAMTRTGLHFHICLVALAGHRRIELTYRSMALQMQLCMVLNNDARRGLEDLHQHVDRHQQILDVVESGDLDAAVTALRNHGHDTFLLELVDRLDGATEDSTAWFAALRRRHAG
ncbi:GntR family transcriptional regulator [Microlunatus soli]|uniref:DNA-binding transcriptional regulator, GntR family n=1 Tax=Microlunatus soli TaxID=630515 RepID=A0A1H1VJF7_9ACTN|nr:GntR family transcriptional regulator [Microlunatus soli]SDS85008.1 DNA-binding transcriptional regulator, GntR family [Microlunatus soli]